MALGAVVAGGDDGRERLVLGAAVVELLAQPPGDLALGAPDEALGDDDGEGEVDERRGAADGLDLGRLLDHAQARHAPAHVPEAAAVGAAQGTEVGIRERPGLIAEGAVRAESLGRGRRRLREQIVGDALDELEVTDLLVHLLVVARVGDDEGDLAADDQGRVLAAEAGQVADVGKVGHDDGVEPERLEDGAAAGEAVRLGGAHPVTPRPTMSASASQALKYPSTPSPLTRTATMSAITE